jgi:AraC-like DNA-binding protein
MLWMKIVDSLNLIVKGSKVEDTAYATGFWDASHMNRSYKTLLGVTPGAIQQLDGKVRIITCSNKNLYSIKTTILKDWNGGDPSAIIEI